MMFLMTVTWKSGAETRQTYDEDMIISAVQDALMFAHQVTTFTVTPL
jgi:hypothetical protein